VGATGVSAQFVLITGIAGLLAGALSMGGGEYVSVSSQRELLDASSPSQESRNALPNLDVDANELARVYRARGTSEGEAAAQAAAVLADTRLAPTPAAHAHDVVGTGLGAAVSSFCFFASGASVPVLPYLFGATGLLAVVVSA